MDEHTRRIFDTGEENRAVAMLLMTQATDAARRWAVVCAFYAAVQYVNALLWERLRLEPYDHRERRSFVVSVSELRPISAAYLRLQERGYDARYRIGFHITIADLRNLLDRDLALVRAAVAQSLNR